jgi:hypothetical protein
MPRLPLPSKGDAELKRCSNCNYVMMTELTTRIMSGKIGIIATARQYKDGDDTSFVAEFELVGEVTRSAVRITLCIALGTMNGAMKTMRNQSEFLGGASCLIT